MEVEITKKINIAQYKAYCEQDENNWSECIVVYDQNNKEVARSNPYHPEGSKYFIWNGYEFLQPSGYSGNPRTLCYVLINDNIYFEDVKI